MNSHELDVVLGRLSTECLRMNHLRVYSKRVTLPFAAVNDIFLNSLLISQISPAGTGMVSRCADDSLDPVVWYTYIRSAASLYSTSYLGDHISSVKSTAIKQASELCGVVITYLEFLLSSLRSNSGSGDGIIVPTCSVHNSVCVYIISICFTYKLPCGVWALQLFD